MTQGATTRAGGLKPGISLGWKVTWGLGALILVSPTISIIVGAEEGSLADNFLFSLFALGCLGFPTMLLIMLVFKSFKTPSSDSVKIGAPPTMMGATNPHYGAVQVTQTHPSVTPLYSQDQNPYQGGPQVHGSDPVKEFQGVSNGGVRGDSTQLPSTESVSELQKKFDREELIGRGGMANVYLGEDKSSGDVVVWKQAAPSRFNSLKEVNDRLSEECSILRSLEHFRIPHLIDQGEVKDETGDTVKVMIMEHVKGSSLSDEVNLLSTRGKTLDYEDSIQVILEVCEALEYMADRDPPMYHRDIKPANIISNPERGAMLIDFGLAKGVAAGNDISVSKGASEGWSPPERRDGVSGPFTDVFSVGQILWHLLTGERPFHAMGKEEKQKLSEGGHPEWIGGLLRGSSLPYTDRIQTISEFRFRLQNEGVMS